MGLETFYPALVLPLVLMLVESSRMLMFLYLLICVVAAGFDGLAVGSALWGVFAVARLILDYLGVYRGASFRVRA